MPRFGVPTADAVAVLTPGSGVSLGLTKLYKRGNVAYVVIDGLSCSSTLGPGATLFTFTSLYTPLDLWRINVINFTTGVAFLCNASGTAIQNVSTLTAGNAIYGSGAWLLA